MSDGQARCRIGERMSVSNYSKTNTGKKQHVLRVLVLAYKEDGEETDSKRRPSASAALSMRP